MPASSCLLLVLACAGIWSQALGSGTSTGHLRIVKEILEHDRRVMPDGNLSGPVVVTMDFSLTSIGDLDESKGVLQVIAIVGYVWKDPRLAAAFETACNSSIRRVVVPAGSSDGIWTPDIELYNSAAPGSVSLNGQRLASVHIDGTVMWFRHLSFSVPCEASPSPFNCTLRFGSWTNSGSETDLAVDSRVVDTTNFINSNRRWALDGRPTIERKDKFYPCCPENYPAVEVTIPLKRRGGETTKT